ncbi:hypothetical protein ACFOD4_00995 [Pseudoroseomonas globiformis]|uniref:Uncharacterized protein n=1 Tax=Teichococcus globiformis TaxID=2307229 RepID=A0ABV7FWI3_9PROT
MGALRLAALAMAVLLAGSEIARRIMTGGAIEALDEVLVAATLLWAAARPSGPRMAAAWGVFGGFSVVLLTTTLAETMRPEGKPGAGLYAALLGGMLALSLWAVRRALRREQPGAFSPRNPAAGRVGRPGGG